MITPTSAKTLVIAAHPDDEVLGAGGWMARYPGTLVAVMSEGTSAQKDWAHDDLLRAQKAKEDAMEDAAIILNAEIVHVGELPDQELSITNIFLRRHVEALIRKHQPTIVLTHLPSELNADHRAVAEAVMVATRPYASSVEWVLGFPVDPWSWGSERQLEFVLELTPQQMAAKLRALAAYHMEMKGATHPRSYENLLAFATWGGARFGVQYGEPYTLIWGRLRSPDVEP